MGKETCLESSGTQTLIENTFISAQESNKNKKAIVLNSKQENVKRGLCSTHGYKRENCVDYLRLMSKVTLETRV